MDNVITQLGLGGFFSIVLFDRATQAVKALRHSRNNGSGQATIAVQLADIHQSLDRSITRLADNINENTATQRQTQELLRRLAVDIGALRNDIDNAHAPE